MSGPFAPRDLGRNGTYVVLRELEQDRVGFHNFAVEKTAELVAHYGSDRLRETVGTEVNPNWFKAKLLGRWQDGRSLVGNPKPLEPGKAPPRLPENDFQYGRDDPRGHACPLGAHARRTNPRDSLLPGDRFEEDITRRHLIIRRGRTYFRNSSGEYPLDSPAENAERGLLFVGLCADLERQFEFIQQTWINFPGFHGLRNEPDPIAAPDNASHLLRNDPEPENGGARKFTIPTAAGPLVVKGMKSFVDFHGGGYFFLPSRSAIRYFVQFSDPDPVGQKF
jgi:deferrochelatase/peroxidase EfeB